MALGVIVGCTSNPLRGQRVDVYRPDVAGRDVVLLGRMPPPPGASVTPNTAGNTSSGTTHVASAASRSLQEGDKVGIYLLGIPKPAEIKDVIDDMGNIQLPLIESVRIAGKTTYEAEKLIEEMYVPKYYRKIEISVVALSVLARADECYLRGEIKKPGRYPWTTDLTLMKAIIAAGGFTEYANPRKVQLRRGETSQFYDTRDIERGKARDPAIKAGDIIIVHRGIV